MMVEMFVHQNSPLLRRHSSEEAVRMSGASGRPGLDHAIDEAGESLTFCDEVSLVEHLEAWDGGRIPPYGRIVTECPGLDEAADKTPDHQARWKHVSQGLLHTLRAVRYGLRRIHLAPLAFAIGSQEESRSLISWLALGSKMFRTQNCLLPGVFVPPGLLKAWRQRKIRSTLIVYAEIRIYVNRYPDRSAAVVERVLKLYAPALRSSVHKRTLTVTCYILVKRRG